MLILCVLIACIHPYTDPIMDYTYRTWSWHCSWHCDRDVTKISLGMIFSLFNASRKFWIYLFTFACMKQVLIRDSIVIHYQASLPIRIWERWSQRSHTRQDSSPVVSFPSPLCNSNAVSSYSALMHAILLRKQQGYGINGINQERHDGMHFEGCRTRNMIMNSPQSPSHKNT